MIGRLHRPVPVALVVLVTLALALGGVAADGSARPAQAQGTAADGPELRLVDQTSWVGPSGQFRVQLRTEAMPPGSTLGFELHSYIGTDRARFAETVAGEDLGPRVYPSTPNGELLTELAAADGTITLTLMVSATFGAPADQVVLPEPGVYPFEVWVEDADGRTVTTLVTYLVRLDTATTSTNYTPLAVALVVPVGAPTAVALDGSPSLSDGDAAIVEAQISAITASPTRQLTVVPSPASLDLLAARDPDGAAALATLGSPAAPYQVLASPYAPIDLGAWVANGLSAEVADQYTAGEGVVDSLIGRIPDQRTAVIDRSVTPEALTRLGRLGVEKVVVPSAQLEPSGRDTGSPTPTQSFELSGILNPMPAVAADDTVAGHLRSEPDPVRAGHLALTELAMIQLGQPSGSRGLAVVVPSDADPVALRTLLDGFDEADGSKSTSVGARMVSAVTLDNLFRVTSPSEPSRGRTPLPKTHQSDRPDPLGSYPGDLGDARRSLDGLRTMLPTAPEVTDPIANSVLNSGSRLLDASARTRMLDFAERSVAATTNEIVVTPDQVVTLTSSSGKVPLNLENRLPVEATVRIIPSSAKLDFPDGPITATIGPAGTTRIDLQVETRASGAFPLDVEIRSANSTLPVATTRYTVRSTAISGIGLALSVGAGLFLAVWWARHFRTSRRARKLVPAEHPGVSGVGPDGYAPPDGDPTEGR